MSVVAAVALVAYLLSRSGSSTVQTVTPTTASTGSNSIDIGLQFAGAAGHELSGDLVTPAHETHPVPGVVIVPDWGAVDRNGMAPTDALPDRLYADLANVLASHGIASLRYDPAGQGQSTIPQGATTLKFSDLVGDAGAALGILAQRFGVDPHRITVVGDGWGGLLALQLAAQDNRLNRLVLVSTPGRPVVDSLAGELQATAISPADGQLEVSQLQQAVSTLLSGGALPDPATLETPLRPFLESSQATYLRSLFGFDPPAVARQVHVPTLIVRGGGDPSLTAEDGQLLTAALGATSQVYVANDASATLTITTRTVVATPSATTTTTILGATTTAGRLGNNIIVTVSRDDQALGAVAQWVLGDTVAAGDTTTTTAPAG
ncbi:MAG: alpha/beta hydrolase [Acidimicrobiales bacterium]